MNVSYTTQHTHTYLKGSCQCFKHFSLKSAYLQKNGLSLCSHISKTIFIHIAYCAAQVACLFIQMCGHSRYRAQKHSVHKSDVVPLRPLKRISQNGNFHFIQRVMILLAYSFHYKISMKYVQNITLKMNWDIQIQTHTTVTGQYDELLKTWINWI